MALGRRRKTASEMASTGSDLSGDQEPALEGIPLAKTEVGRPAPVNLKTEEIKMLAKSG